MVILVKAPETAGVKDCHCVDPVVETVESLAIFRSAVSSVILEATLNVPKKVLFPAKDCVPVLTTPPLVASAGVRLKTPLLSMAPFALDVFVMVPTEMELDPPVLAMVIDPFPFVIEIPEPAVSVAFDKVFPTVFPINS